MDKKESSFSLKDYKNGERPGGEPCSMFKGAELEYTIIGSQNELGNQCATYMQIYMLRVLADLFPVLTDKSLSTLSSPLGPFAWIPKVIGVIVEPMCDMIFIANGDKEPLIKKSIYFSPKGFIKQTKK